MQRETGNQGTGLQIQVCVALDKFSLGVLAVEMETMTPIHGLGEYLGRMKCSLDGSLSPSTSVWISPPSSPHLCPEPQLPRPGVLPLSLIALITSGILPLPRSRALFRTTQRSSQTLSSSGFGRPLVSPSVTAPPRSPSL